MLSPALFTLLAINGLHKHMKFADDTADLYLNTSRTKEVIVGYRGPRERDQAPLFLQWEAF